jgi:putative ABC transport system ATP-binding protein
MTTTASVTTTTLAAARIEDGTKRYGTTDGGVLALDAVTLDIPARRWTAIMGPSGSGKSTLLHCMSGLDALTSGRTSIGDQDLGELDDDALTRLRRERVGFVFQSFNLIPTLTAAENLALPFTFAGRRPEEAVIAATLEQVGLADRADHRPSQLSGGQQQRVALARALVTEPAIVFADEPTGNLDSRAGGEVLALLRRAVDDSGRTVAMVTHDPAAAAWSDEVLFLADGRLVDRMAQPTAERVLDRMKTLGG